ALGLSVAAVHVLAARLEGAPHRPVAVVGRDPRASGEMLEAAVVAGLTSAGATVLRAGVLPTPAIAYLTADIGADLGVMLSASHNPMPDNGIKLFARGGHKLPDAVEDEIEAQFSRGERWARPTGADIGRVRNLDDAVDRYAEHLLSALPHKLDGLRVVVDCAHGSAARVAPLVLARAGAEVIALAAEPDGLNINDRVGSTHLDVLAAAVLDTGADVGIAHDGDADRCLAVTSTGEIVDGDVILAVCALALREAGRLRDDTVVATVMSNLGFHHAMRDAGIGVVTTAVGDRYVLEELHARRLSVGGEQSGHLIFLDHATTGDGILTALQLLSRVASTGEPLAGLAAVVRRLPQVLLNVPVADKARVATSPAVVDAVAAVERDLGDDGRVLLRPSGTEQIVRVMVEALTQDHADAIAHHLATIVAAS
ncbi:MAG: phosphoglucosamine mutase, partial [Mycobacteriales bacterium]